MSVRRTFYVKFETDFCENSWTVSMYVRWGEDRIWLALFCRFSVFEILYIKETTAYDYCTPYFPQLISIFICHSCFLAGKMKFYKGITQKPKNDYNFCWRLNYYFSKESNPYNILQRHKKKKNMWTYINSRLWSLISWKYFVYIDKFLLKFSSL